jgi:hypothetical protein
MDVVGLAPHRSALRKLYRTRTDGSDLLEANAGVAAGMPCSWPGRDYSGCNRAGCSRSSSLHELIQQTGNKPVERVGYVGKNATAVTCDHPRSRRKSIRSRGFRQRMNSKGYERGHSLRNIHDKKSIYISVARDRGHRACKRKCTTRILWLIASKLIRGNKIF